MAKTIHAGFSIPFFGMCVKRNGGVWMLRSIWAACLALAVLFATVWLQLRLEAGSQAPPPVPVQSGTPEPADRPVEGDAGRRLRVLCGDEVREMDLRDYLFGVLAAEMPADFEPEALKAQAVAARTYALWCMRGGRHEGADVCTDYRCCQAWRDDAALREAWGASYEDRAAKLRSALDATDGEYLSYEGLPAFAAFHSSSAGFTEDSGAIWSALPYLVSVSSPEDAESVPGYVSEAVFPALDFRDTLLYDKPEADFSGPPEGWIGETERDGSGRVAWMELGGVRFSGTQLRALFSLRSTAFTLGCADGLFTFTVTGFGHGVGMSQYGAQALAAQGWDYAAILAHYYPGTALTR